MKKFSILFSILFILLVISFSNAQSGWFSIYTGYSEYITKIQFLDSNTGYAAGTNNILKSTNGGVNWFSVKTNTNVGFYSLYFLNDLTGFAGGVTNYLCKTTNGGVNWSDIFTDYSCMSINFGDNITGYITSEYIYPGYMVIRKTTDGGATWMNLSPTQYCRNLFLSMVIQDMGRMVNMEGLLRKLPMGQYIGVVKL